MKKKILIIYTLLLLNFVVFKFYGNINELIERINSIRMDRNEGYWNINLTSLFVLKRYLTTFKSEIIKGNLTNYAILNILGNIIPFIPFGFLVPFTFDKINNIYKFILVSSIFIVSIEFLQFITLLGFCDIQDFILNMVGCLLGYIIFKCMSILFKRKNV